MPPFDRIRNSDEEYVRQLFNATTPDAPRVDIQQLLEKSHQIPVEKHRFDASTNHRLDSVLPMGPSDQSGGESGAKPFFAFVSRMPFRTVVSVAFVLGAILLPVWLMTQIVQPREAFARSSFSAVQERVEKLKTVQFTTFTSYPDEQEPPSLPKKFRVKILGRNLQRFEVLGHPESYDLMDSTTGMLINVNTVNKTFCIFKTRVSTDPKTGVVQKTDFVGRREADFYDEITRVRVSDVTWRGVTTFNGKTTERFEEQAVNGLTTWTRTTWVDSESKLPVHIEIRLQSKDPNVREYEMTHTDFVYDEQLDSSQFSVTPPEGYRVIDGEFFDKPKKTNREN